jgi:hypothetical protein
MTRTDRAGTSPGSGLSNYALRPPRHRAAAALRPRLHSRRLGGTERRHAASAPHLRPAAFLCCAPRWRCLPAPRCCWPTPALPLRLRRPSRQQRAARQGAALAAAAHSLRCAERRRLAAPPRRCLAVPRTRLAACATRAWHRRRRRPRHGARRDGLALARQRPTLTSCQRHRCEEAAQQQSAAATCASARPPASCVAAHRRRERRLRCCGGGIRGCRLTQRQRLCPWKMTMLRLL